MHIETIQFDRIFDLHQHPGSKYTPVHTDFSFESKGRKTYAVRVMGWPSIKPGMKITALLREKDDWQTLSGWKNHTNGKVVLPALDRSKYSAFVGAGVTIISLYGNFMAETTIGEVAALCATTFFFLITVSNFFQWRRYEAEARIIRELPALPDNTV